jgi:hypothetical protein
MPMLKGRENAITRGQGHKFGLAKKMVQRRRGGPRRGLMQRGGGQRKQF